MRLETFFKWYPTSWFRLAQTGCLILAWNGKQGALVALGILFGAELARAALKLVMAAQLASGKESRLNAKLEALNAKHLELEEKVRQLTNRGH